MKATQNSEYNPQTGSTPELTSSQLNERSKKQNHATTGGNMLMISMGIYSLWGIYLVHYPNEYGYQTINVNKSDKTHVFICWNIALILGTIVGVILDSKLIRKKIIYYISGILVLASGILFMPLPPSILRIIIGRYLAGFGQGIAYITLIIHGSEIAIKQRRGQVLGSTSFNITTSIFIAALMMGLFTIYGDENFTVDQMFGILVIIFSVLSLAATKFLTIESPVLYIEKGNDIQAISTIKKLRKETYDTTETNHDFVELKTMLNDENESFMEVFSSGNRRALFRVVVLRCLSALSNSYWIYGLIKILLILLSQWFAIAIVSGAQFVGGFISLLCIDALGRRWLLILSTTLSGLTIFIMGVLWPDVLFKYHTVIEVLFIAYGLFIGLGLSTVSTVYLGESFSVRRRPYSVAFSIIVENILQIIFGILFVYGSTNISAFMITTGLLLALTAPFFFKMTKETKGLSPTEARDALK